MSVKLIRKAILLEFSSMKNFLFSSFYSYLTSFILHNFSFSIAYNLIFISLDSVALRETNDIKSSIFLEAAKV